MSVALVGMIIARFIFLLRLGLECRAHNLLEVDDTFFMNKMYILDLRGLRIIFRD